MKTYRTLSGKSWEGGCDYAAKNYAPSLMKVNHYEVPEKNLTFISWYAQFLSQNCVGGYSKQKK
jgi:hypothetical protein